MSDWWNQPARPTVGPGPSTSEPLSVCPWCAEPAEPGAAHCSSCGAVMAQHEDLGGLVIAGVTAVDPAMNAGGYSSTFVGSQSRMSALNSIGWDWARNSRTFSVGANSACSCRLRPSQAKRSGARWCKPPGKVNRLERTRFVFPGGA